MGESIRFEAGRTVVFRNFRQADIQALESAQVASHDERGLVAWIPHGAPCLARETLDGRSIRGWNPTQLASARTRLVESTWIPGGTLVLTPPKSRFAVHWWFDPAGRFTGWYINLQSEAALWDDGTLGGVDYVDQCLDVIVPPDRTWRWKDEDEFRARTGSPMFYSAEEAEQIREEGIRLIALAEAGRYPFDGTWTDFHPPTEWSPPSPRIPEGWDRLGFSGGAQQRSSAGLA